MLRRGTGAELFYFTWFPDYPSMDDCLYPLYQSSQTSLWNLCHFRDPLVDRLLLRARGTADARQRQNLYAQAEQRVIDDYAVVPVSNATASAQLSLVANRRFRGLSITPYEAVDLWKVWDTKTPAH